MKYFTLFKSCVKIVFIFSFFLMLFAFKLHPYHVGSVELSYNQKSKKFEVTGKFFLDDLENAINKKYGTTLHFQDEKFKNELNEKLRKYTDECLRLKTDNQFVKLNYLGYEEDHESVNVYLESESIASPKKVEVAVTFLYNIFGDQLNIIHIIVNGTRKSDRLSYPNRYLYQPF